MITDISMIIFVIRPDRLAKRPGSVGVIQ